MGHVCVVHYVLCIVCYVLCVVCMSFMLCVVCMSFMLCDYAGQAGMLHHAKSDIVVFFLKIYSHLLHITVYTTWVSFLSAPGCCLLTPLGQEVVVCTVHCLGSRHCCSCNRAAKD